MPNATIATIAMVILLAIVFDFINGFHDTANAIATSVSTRVLSPRAAIAMSAACNFIGAFISINVAITIGSGIVNPHQITLQVIIAALIAAIIWNLATWYFGLPSSSSHALIGGLLGAAVVFKGSLTVIDWPSFLWKVLLWLFLSPVIGFLAGFVLMTALNWILKPLRPRTVTTIFSKAQIISAALMALNHGSNDAQKSMGVISLALFSGGLIANFYVPLWVITTCALAMALGTSVGGWKIIKTLGVSWRASFRLAVLPQKPGCHGDPHGDHAACACKHHPHHLHVDHGCGCLKKTHFREMDHRQKYCLGVGINNTCQCCPIRVSYFMPSAGCRPSRARHSASTHAILS